MGGILIYAIESSICLSLLWFFYELTLRSDTRHRRNRYFLLASMIFSMVVPLLNFNMAIPGNIMPEGGLAAVLLPEVMVTPPGMTHEPDLWQSLLPVLYMAGVVVSAGFMVIRFITIFRLRRHGNRNGRVIRIDSRDPVCFSAFGEIFLSSSVTDNNASRMISHEMQHVALGHHADLLFTGVIELIQWFNPAAYMVRRSLQAVHEYEADNRCMKDGEEARSYQELLLNSILNTRIPFLSNTFSNRSLLKNRMIMMTKKRTGRSASLKLIIALPLVLVLLLAFSCKERTKSVREAAPAEEAGQVAQAPSEVFTTVDVMPVFQDDTTHMALMQWVGKNMTYPNEAVMNGIQGKVIVKFIIDENGNVTDPEIVRGVDTLLDQAALDVISKCPQWSPGLQDGKPVKVSFTLPVNFALQ
jgi:TonB family protein